jgi:iron(III) transport system substrate-binding protein
MVRLLALALLLLCGAASAQDVGGRDQAWNDLIAAAQREGKVVVIGPAHQEVRKVLPAAFKQRFGVELEYLGGPGGIAATRLRSERSASIYSADVALAAIQTLATVFYDEKMLDPIKPLLILPDVLDGSKWKRGELWFPDPEHKYVLRLFNYVSEVFSVNTRLVKPADMTNVRDLLLNPKFKGKIALHDPTSSGTGSNVAAQFYVQLGEDFVRRLYVDQNPAISRDERQLTDWLLRGTHAIAVGSDFTEVEKMAKEDLPVRSIFSMPGLVAPLSAGNGMVAVFNRAPHPSAAKLFVNWIASKEGLEVYSRASTRATTRNDIDEASYIPVENIPIQGVEYFDAYDWEFSTVVKAKVRLLMKDLLGR